MDDATPQADSGFLLPELDLAFLEGFLIRLLNTPSPTGYVGPALRLICSELQKLGINFEMTRRGAVRAILKGKRKRPARAVIAHVDTLGAMVRELKSNGRLGIAPIGGWNARFAEGARVTIHAEHHRHWRGTILPLKASGHTFGPEVDKQPSSWDTLEIRLDEHLRNQEDLMKLGVHVGDFVAIDANPEVTQNGFINARHLDDKAGVAAMLTAVKAITETGIVPAVDTHILFSISEEVGVGASHVFQDNISEMVAVDNGTFAPGQNTSELGVTICMMDRSGPFDLHLTRLLLGLCRHHGLEHARDIFRYYRCDAASAVEAGNDLRAGLIAFGLDASHGWERVHIDSLRTVARLLTLYMQAPPSFKRDRFNLASVDDRPGPPA